MTGDEVGSQGHMFIRAADMVADDCNETRYSSATTTMETLSLEYYQLLVGYEFLSGLLGRDVHSPTILQVSQLNHTAQSYGSVGS